MICVEKDGKIELLPQASYQSCYLTDADELAFALGHTNQYWDLNFLRGCQHRLQQNPVPDVEMADRHSSFLCLLQSML